VEFANVLMEKEGRVAVLTVNRPKALNALNKDTLFKSSYGKKWLEI